MIRVLLVDDSAAVRGFLRKVINEQTDMEICGSAGDGEEGILRYFELKPDIVLLDVEMPVLSGLEALQHILDKDPHARIIMCSTFTEAGSDIAIEALRIGAVDVLQKPAASEMSKGAQNFYNSLYKKIRSAAPQYNQVTQNTLPSGNEGQALKGKSGGGGVVSSAPSSGLPPLLLKPSSFYKADIIAIGSSTGGVQALFNVLDSLGTKTPGVPIVITQHMPATFTKILANHINDKIGIPAHEAEENMPVENNHIYIAKGGNHMEIIRKDGGLFLHLSDAPPENFCRPSVDPMLRSLLAADMQHIMAIILTGMGNDGLYGCKDIIEKGHMVIAQDEQSSVVWGMPGAVAMAGLCHAVLPLDDIGHYIAQYLQPD